MCGIHQRTGRVGVRRARTEHHGSLRELPDTEDAVEHGVLVTGTLGTHEVPDPEGGASELDRSSPPPRRSAEP